MVRDLPVHVYGSEFGRRRVQFAANLAVSTGARFSGIHVTPLPAVPPLYKLTRVEEVAAHLSSQLALDAKAAAMVFRGRAYNCTISWALKSVSLASRRRGLVQTCFFASKN